MTPTSLLSRAATAALVLAGAQALAADNVAPLGTATQSSNWTSVAVGGPAKAIDGNTDGVWTGAAATNSVQHTGTDLNNGVGNGFAWWQVALDQDYVVDSVAIWNRTDGSWENRLRSFTVTLWDDGAQVWSGSYAMATGPSPSTSFTVGGLVGDTVRVQLDRRDYLHMAEVQVFATPVPEPATVALILAGLALVGAAARQRT